MSDVIKEQAAERMAVRMKALLDEMKALHGMYWRARMEPAAKLIRAEQARVGKGDVLAAALTVAKRPGQVPQMVLAAGVQLALDEELAAQAGGSPR